jgi:Ca-activated chloride channel family protein
MIAVAALLLLYLLVQLRRKKNVVRFTNVALLSHLAPKRPGWRRHVSFGLLLLSLAAFTVAMARPATVVRVPRDRATVVMVIDVSLSMEATDVTPSRIEAAKKAAKEFAELLPKSVNLGLVSFSGRVTVQAEPTTNRQLVEQKIDNLQLAESTATGDAIIAAVDELKSFENTLGGESDEVPARIVMLSDGARTVGRPVDQGIAAAKDAKIPISTIAFGTLDGVVNLEGQRQPVPVDTATMKEIAEGTGGTYHAAASEQELRSIYANLGSQIGYVDKPREVTTWAVGIGLILAFAGAGAALWWSNRLL